MFKQVHLILCSLWFLQESLLRALIYVQQWPKHHYFSHQQSIHGAADRIIVPCRYPNLLNKTHSLQGEFFLRQRIKLLIRIQFPESKCQDVQRKAQLSLRNIYFQPQRNGEERQRGSDKGSSTINIFPFVLGLWLWFVNGKKILKTSLSFTDSS